MKGFNKIFPEYFDGTRWDLHRVLEEDRTLRCDLIDPYGDSALTISIDTYITISIINESWICKLGRELQSSGMHGVACYASEESELISWLDEQSFGDRTFLTPPGFKLIHYRFMLFDDLVDVVANEDPIVQRHKRTDSPT